MRKMFVLTQLILMLGMTGIPTTLAHSESTWDRILKEPPDKIIAELRSDDIHWNAIHAQGVIHYYMSDSFHDQDQWVDRLEKALDSDDWQQRQIAADILRGFQDYTPRERLIEVTVEGLRDDQFPGWRNEKNIVFIFNATSGLAYLMNHSTLGTKSLKAALDSEDHQQRLLAALVLASTGRGDPIEKITQILIPNLKDDSFYQNACLATYALYHLGKPVIPYLKPFQNSEDFQQRITVQLILTDLLNPPKNNNEKYSRIRYNQITRFCPDPAVDYWHPWMEILSGISGPDYFQRKFQLP